MGVTLSLAFFTVLFLTEALVGVKDWTTGEGCSFYSGDEGQSQSQSSQSRVGEGDFFLLFLDVIIRDKNMIHFLGGQRAR